MGIKERVIVLRWGFWLRFRNVHVERNFDEKFKWGLVDSIDCTGRKMDDFIDVRVAWTLRVYRSMDTNYKNDRVMIWINKRLAKLIILKILIRQLS